MTATFRGSSMSVVWLMSCTRVGVPASRTRDSSRSAEALDDRRWRRAETAESRRMAVPDFRAETRDLNERIPRGAPFLAQTIYHTPYFGARLAKVGSLRRVRRRRP